MEDGRDLVHGLFFPTTRQIAGKCGENAISCRKPKVENGEKFLIIVTSSFGGTSFRPFKSNFSPTTHHATEIQDIQACHSLLYPAYFSPVRLGI